MFALVFVRNPRSSCVASTSSPTLLQCRSVVPRERQTNHIRRGISNLQPPTEGGKNRRGPFNRFFPNICTSLSHEKTSGGDEQLPVLLVRPNGRVALSLEATRNATVSSSAGMVLCTILEMEPCDMETPSVTTPQVATEENIATTSFNVCNLYAPLQVVMTPHRSDAPHSRTVPHWSAQLAPSPGDGCRHLLLQGRRQRATP